MSDPTKFNDPFECRPHLTVDGNSVERKEFLKELTKDKFPNADEEKEKNRYKKDLSLKIRTS